MKRAKKRWDWTPKNLRRTQSKHQRGYWLGPSKGFKEMFNVIYDTMDKKALKNELEGRDFEYVQNKRRFSECKWYWW